jgi:hypothetical protein
VVGENNQMAYTGSAAISGNGTKLNINTGTVASPTWTLVGEVTEIAESGKQNKSDDTTNLESSATEFIPTIVDSGTFKITMNAVVDTGQAAMATSFYALPPTIVQYQIVLPKMTGQATTPNKGVFSAMVEDFDDVGTIKADKKISISASLKVSGVIVWTQGS